MDATTTEQQTGERFHTRFKEVRRTDQVCVLDRQDMEWLPKNDVVTSIPLSLVKRHNGSEFYIGSAIRGGLVPIAEGLDRHLGNEANKIFYATVERYLDDRRVVDRIDHPLSSREIRYAKNGTAVRVYFMVCEKINGKPVIIRVAASHGKQAEEKVYGLICADIASERKRRLYGR